MGRKNKKKNEKNSRRVKDDGKEKRLSLMELATWKVSGGEGIIRVIILAMKNLAA